MWRPFHYRAFAILWSATLVANIGSWMYSSAAAWLMTTLDSDPLMVSLVQVASSLPMFLFALPAGALADTVDKRRFLICAEIYIAVVSLAFAFMVWAHHITVAGILVFTFLVEIGSALTAPAWQSVVPDLVARTDLAPAVAMNSVGVNISRALGPALGGALTVVFGVAMPFWVNGLSNFGTIGALAAWRPPKRAPASLPSERFINAIRTGVRHAFHNRLLQAALVRSTAFFLFGSCYWALLPLVAKRIAASASLYGSLLGAIGASAIAGAFVLPWLKRTLGANRVVAAGSIGTALSMILYGAAREPILAVLASLIAGISWIAVLANLNVSAQLALPEWVRARGLAVYVTVFFGAMTLGSVVWGEVSHVCGLPIALYAAAAGMIIFIPLTRRWKLQAGKHVDLAPSMHWPTPVVSTPITGDSGPVLVTTEYVIKEKDRDLFLAAIGKLSQERGRDGAFDWGIFEDISRPGRFLETFAVDSWLEHLRQHNRVTNADRIVEDEIHHLLERSPETTHFIAAQRRET
jgi:MFS family permease